MDFTESLKKALELGVSKEEFFRAWEAETEIKLKNELGEVSGYRSEFLRGQISEDPDSKYDQTSWQQVREELRQDLHSKLELLFHQQMEKQNRQWELVHSKNNQMAENFQRNFDILCQHVSNAVAEQGSALKLHLMQEFDLLRQNFAQIIEEHNVTHTSEPKASAASHNQIRQQSASAQQNCVDVGNIKDGFKKPVVNQKQQYIAQVEKNEAIPQVVDEDADELSVSTYDWCGMEDAEEASAIMDGGERNNGDNDRPGQEVHSKKSESHVREYRRSGKQTTAGTNHLIQQPAMFPNCTHNARSPNQVSTEATGFYADIISNQLKENYPPEGSLSTSSKKSKDPLISAREKEALNAIIYASLHSSSHSKSTRDKLLQKFTIPNCDQLITSRKPYLSPFMYAPTKSWKAQLCVSFNANEQLKVQVLVSNGGADSDLGWPIQLSCAGHIFHEGSREFTEIWQLPAVVCQKPSGTGEIVFQAKVDLLTTRGSYPDVKYGDLEFRKYTSKNQLTFRWNVKAKKRY